MLHNLTSVTVDREDVKTEGVAVDQCDDGDARIKAVGERLDEMPRRNVWVAFPLRIISAHTPTEQQEGRPTVTTRPRPGIVSWLVIPSRHSVWNTASFSTTMIHLTSFSRLNDSMSSPTGIFIPWYQGSFQNSSKKTRL